MSESVGNVDSLNDDTDEQSVIPKPPLDDRIRSRHSWVKIGVIAVVIGIVGWKVVTTPMKIDLTGFDFSDLLALALALFAIGLSVVFYRQSAETSDRFHQNTYIFTNRTSELLGRIEKGFGEQLRSLSMSQDSMRESVQNLEGLRESTERATQKEDEKGQERDDFIQNLIEQLKLADEDKAGLTRQFHEKNEEYRRAQDEAEHYKNRLALAEVDRSNDRDRETDTQSNPFILARAIFNYFVNIAPQGATPIELKSVAEKWFSIQPTLDQKILGTAGFFTPKGLLTELGYRMYLDLIE
jgi:hypothetical protein